MSKYILYFIFILCFIQMHVSYDYSHNLNVGTTLFSEADVYRQCWSSENIAILTTRMVLEDLLPPVNTLIFDNDEFVNDIIEYFKLILDVVKHETYGKTKHITLIAFTDILGGYFNTAVLPMAKFSYYSGLIEYDSVQKLFQLFDELKWFLRTSGQGWSKPIPQDINGCVVPLIIEEPTKHMHPCNCLNFQSKKVCKQRRRDVKIPLPFLDSRDRPGSIAVPFKTQPLRNIERKCASYIIMKYYIMSYKCLLSQNASRDSIQRFQNQLFSWISSDVLPILNDEKFYSAFGGVLRVFSALKTDGAKIVQLTSKTSKDKNKCKSHNICGDYHYKPVVNLEEHRSIWLIFPLFGLLLLACVITLCCIRSCTRRRCACRRDQGSSYEASSSFTPQSSAKGNPRGKSVKISSSFSSSSRDSEAKPAKLKKSFSDPPSMKRHIGYVSTESDISYKQCPMETISESDKPWPAPQMTPYCDCSVALTGGYAIDLNSVDPDGGASYLPFYDELETSSTNYTRDDTYVSKE